MGGDNDNKAAKIKYQKSYFDVLGICCASEVPLVENILKSLNGIKEFSVVVPTKTVIVVHDNLIISQLQIVKALNQARLEANIRVKGDTSHEKKWPSPFAIASGVLLLLSLLKYAYHPFGWLALGAVAVGIPPMLLKAIASLKNLRLDTNILMLISVIGTIALKDYVEAGFIVFLFRIAEWLESRASHKANAVMSSLMSITPQKAVIAETGEEIDADEVKLNTIIAVKAGEIIPIDGIVVDGNCEVDEKTLTGESFPVHKEKDSTVLAGTINLNGYISVKTTALAEDCVVAKMAKLVEQAQNSKSRAQRLIDKCAQYYTPAVIIMSACLVVVPLALRVRNRSRWFHLALVVLVSACPCALILSTPVATFCGLTKAATSGVLIKGGDYLETLAKIKVMAFDKTGTITRGEFVVTEFKSLCEDISLHDLVYWVSSIESKSSHPMAAALVDHARSLSIEPNPEIVTDFQNFPGEGITAKIDGKDIYIGNKKIGTRAGHASVSNQQIEKKGGKSVGYVYYGAALVGIFSLYDVCRIGASEAISKLKSMGIKTAMLTGDCEEAAMAAQRQLGDALEVIRSELLPEDKAKFIEEFKKEGTTAMIGDGVNDAPALATANIGISMGISGSALATETGDVILMSNDVTKIPKVINLARKTRRKVIENVILSISTKSAILALAFAGHPLVWAAVLADVGTCLLVIFNSMLLLRETRHNYGGKCCKSSSSAAINAKKCHSNESSQKHCCSNEKVADTCDSHESSHHHSHCCTDETVADTCNTHEYHCHDSICQPGDSHVTSSCEKDNLCSHSSDRHDDNVKDFRHGNSCCKPVDLEANNPHNHCHNNVSNHCISNHLNHTTNTKEAGKNSMNKIGHCHSHKHNEDHVNIRVEDESSEILSESSSCVVKKCCSGNKSSLKCSSVVDVRKDTSHIETTKPHCLSLEKRETGGCCKSYMKECCEKQGQSKDHVNIRVDEESSEISSEISGESSSCVVKKCCSGHKSSLKCYSIVDVRKDTNHIETTKPHCLSLEKRETRGCCKSYMKECCGKQGQFATTGFCGGLPEIITE